MKDRARPDPRTLANRHVAVDHCALSYERALADMHAVRYKGLRSDARVGFNMGILTKHARGKDGAGEHVNAVTQDKSARMLHLQQRISGSHRLHADSADHRLGCHLLPRDAVDSGLHGS